MSRVHYFSFIADDHGYPLAGANVNIYLAGTETPAKIYDTEFGGLPTEELPQVITNAKGYFEFWVSDLESPDGYPYGQKFKIAWDKTGISSGYIDWIDIFPSVYPVDENNTESDVKNKLVSDRLVYNWETHLSHDVRLDYFPIHGLEAFNPIGDVDTIQGTFTAEHNLINKVISDKYAYIWDNHSLFSFKDMIILSETDFTSATSAASAEFGSNFDIYNNTAHGLQPAEFNDNDIYFNKLVSNELLTKYISRDGIQSFTHPVSGMYPEISNHLTTKEYVDELTIKNSKNNFTKKIFNIDTKDWKPKQDSEFYYIINHSFNEEFPNITIWNNDTKRIDNNYNLTALNHQQIIIYSDSRSNLSIITDNNITKEPYVSKRKFIEDDWELLDDKYFITIEYNNDYVYPYVQVWDYDTRKLHINNVIYKHPSENNKLIIKVDDPINCIVNVTDKLNVDNRKTIIKSIEESSVFYYDINSWSYDGSVYYKIIEHNTGKLYPSIISWNTTDNLVEKLYDIESIDENTIKVYIETPKNIKITIDNGNYDNFQIIEDEWVYNPWGDYYYTLLKHKIGNLYNNITSWNIDINKIEYLSEISVIDYDTVLLKTDNPINISVNIQHYLHSETINEDYWIEEGPDTYEYIINHNKNIEYPLCSVWNLKYRREEVEFIRDIEYINENSVKIIVTEPIEARINISSGYLLNINEYDITNNPVDVITILDSDWVYENNMYRIEVSHNLNILNPHIYFWDIDLNRIVDVYDIENINENTVVIYSVTTGNIIASFENNFGDFNSYLNYLRPSLLSKKGDSMLGILDMAGNTIRNLPLPIYQDEAVNKEYIDDQIDILKSNILLVLGLDDGEYIPDTSSNYITTANSFYEADQLLDDQIKLNEESIAQEVIDRGFADGNLQTELDDTQTGAGLGTDGSYTADASTNYITSTDFSNAGLTVDLFNADILLDAQVKINEDDIDQLNSDLTSGLALKVSKSGDIMSGNLNMTGNRIISLGNPTADYDAANKFYVDSVAQGLIVKDSVRVATTTNITLSGLQTIDGVAVVADDRVLVKNQTTATENGVYVAVDGGAWTRAEDFDGTPTHEVRGGCFTFVQDGGTINGNSGWVVINDGEVALGTDPVNWTQFTGLGQIVAGAGLQKDGNEIFIGFGAGIVELPTDEVGLDLYTNGGLWLTTNGTTENETTDGQLSIKLADTSLTLSTAGLQISSAFSSNVDNIQNELDDTQAGAGLSAIGGYTAAVGSNYLKSADFTAASLTESLYNADLLLDAQIKLNEDDIYDLSNNYKREYTINTTDWSFYSGGNYSYTIIHNLNVNYPTITIWNTDTKEMENVSNIISLDNNSFRIIVKYQLNLMVKVIK